jgi:hypothetical protein
MAAKDFMAPKNTAASTTANSDCGAVKTYGAQARPGANAAAEAFRKSELKPTIEKSSVTVAGGAKSVSAPQTSNTNGVYQHETGNVVANPGSIGADDFGKLNLNLQFQPNVLDNFDAVTYHLKLFIVDPDTSSSGEVFNTDKQIIIAESGVTDLTIDKLEVRSIVTPSVEGGTGITRSVKFEIIEPSGAGLIDKMFYQSLALGIYNWSVMPVYLQLQFRGRNPDTSAPDDGSPGSLSSLKWLWTLKISRIKANVTHVGTRYEFEAIVYDDFAQSNAIFTLQHNVVLNDIEYFEDAMRELENKLNADQLIKLIDNYSIPDSFKIVVDPKIARCVITPSNKNTNSRRNDNYGSFDNKDATFQAGTGVDKIIDTLLAQTEDYQKSMLGAPVPGAEGSNMNQEPSQMKKFWRIITETRPLRFDPRRNDIAKEFTIFVVEYDIGILDQNIFQTSAPPVTLEAQRKRLMTYVQKSILKKKYNYIFTGLNDQVINFDITINNAFANAQARLGGVYINPFMADKGVVTHEHSKQEAEVTAALSRAISFQNSATTANSQGAKDAMIDARTKIDASGLDDATKSRYKTLLDKSKPDSRLGFIQAAQNSGGIENNGDLSTSRTNATKLSRSVTEGITEKQFNFISDVQVSSQGSKDAYSAFMQNMKGKLRPIARIESMQDRQIGMGIESSSNSGIQKLSTMFATALHSGLDSSLQRIRMTIKGDPFWVFPQPYKNDTDKVFNSLKGESVAVEWIKNAHKNLVDAANIYGTDNFILIRFRTPQIFQGDEAGTNADGNSDVETLSGIYKVVTITSRFEGGKFTQELDSILDPEISILNIADQIEEDAKKNTSINKEADIPITTIPEPSIRKDRIMGSITDAQGQVIAVANSINEIAAKGTQLASNIPTVATNTIPGFPNIFT